MTRVIAVLCADIHLSHAAPVARSAEPDWYAAQGRYLEQLRSISVHNDMVPIVCAGDVFDRWNSPPELINWAIQNLPHLISVPGQHDLPLHDRGSIRRSAYWTLVEAGRVEDLTPGSRCCPWEGLLLYGFPFGFDLEPCKREGKGVHLAVCHRYVWIASENAYPGAPMENRLACMNQQLKGYTAAVFGDNHIGFHYRLSAPRRDVLNCGCLIPRKLDERRHVPAVGLLHEDGTITRQPLDCSQDRWIDEPEDPEARAALGGMDEFLGELRGLEQERVDFREAVRQWCSDNRVGDGAKQVLLETLEECG